MSRKTEIDLFLPPLARLAIAEANMKILECYRSLKGHDDPAAALMFGLSDKQYEIVRNLSHSDIRWAANNGLPLWQSRFDLVSLNDKPELDRDRVITELLKTF
ncbi:MULTISPECIES: hypothetical protein [unclassified Paraburkholderia]|uniref:hypothetical protein n=1 Tax=unclassified Paraburkholderia TaxID=2615204 RepID=UPI002AB0A792|nr:MULTISPECIES: hypothetical protein [unclassified Paraburkholderia]